jgi:hypothetical protein
MHLLSLIVVVVLVLLRLPLVIDSRQHEISFNEEAPIGTIIFDLNTLSSTQITYQLLESSLLLTFNATTNFISISKRIDRDSQCANDETCSACSLTMKFYDMFYYDILILKFRIDDINDNPPVFSSSTYSISITENNMPGIRIRLSKADDIDCLTHGVQSYELAYVHHDHMRLSSISLQHSTNQTFRHNEFSLFYDQQTTELYLIINRTLDRELHAEYRFTITANDYTHTTSSTLHLTVLDVNDHLARFSQSIYSVNISHNTLPDTKLLQLTAVDDDLGDNARIYYSLLTIDGVTNRHDLFRIHSQTGELRLLTNLTQWDTKRIYKLIVAASDGTSNAIPALTTVYINIIPQSRITITFGSNRVSNNQSQVLIDENLPNATFIAYITSDEPLEILSNSIDRGYFIQKLSDNSLTLLTDRSYDREQRSSYDVHVRSRDNHRHFQILVVDVNDCPPMWNMSMLNIDLDLDLRTIILNAIDLDDGLNARIAYRQQGPTWPDWIDLIDNQLIINCTNITIHSCWYDLIQNDLFIDIQAFDYGTPELSSTMTIHLFRRSTQIMFNKSDYLLALVASLLGVCLVVLCLSACLYCQRRQATKPTTIVNEQTNSSKQVIIQTSEPSSSAGSLYGSDKSDNITLETAASCHLVSSTVNDCHKYRFSLCCLHICTHTLSLSLIRICFSSRRNEQ